MIVKKFNNRDLIPLLGAVLVLVVSIVLVIVACLQARSRINEIKLRQQALDVPSTTTEPPLQLIELYNGTLVASRGAVGDSKDTPRKKLKEDDTAEKLEKTRKQMEELDQLYKLLKSQM